MVSHVELSDEAAARTAARALAAQGDRLGDSSGPPCANFGDDKFGDRMREEYFGTAGDSVSLPEECRSEKQKLGDRLSELGEKTTEALAELETQEEDNAGSIHRAPTPTPAV